MAKIERPPNWMEMSPDGVPWADAGKPPLRYRRFPRDFRPRHHSEEEMDERWTAWEEQHNKYENLATATCKECGYPDVPMYFLGGMEGSGGQCPQCGKHVRYDEDDPDVDDS